RTEGRVDIHAHAVHIEKGEAIGQTGEQTRGKIELLFQCSFVFLLLGNVLDHAYNTGGRAVLDDGTPSDAHPPQLVVAGNEWTDAFDRLVLDQDTRERALEFRAVLRVVVVETLLEREVGARGHAIDLVHLIRKGCLARGHVHLPRAERTDALCGGKQEL